MADIIAQLKEKERKIRDLQQNKAKQDGQREQLLTQLKSEFGVETLDAATDKLEQMQKEIAANEKILGELNDKMAQIVAKAEA